MEPSRHHKVCLVSMPSGESRVAVVARQDSSYSVVGARQFVPKLDSPTESFARLHKQSSSSRLLTLLLTPWCQQPAAVARVHPPPHKFGHKEQMAAVEGDRPCARTARATPPKLPPPQTLSHSSSLHDQGLAGHLQHALHSGRAPDEPTRVHKHTAGDARDLGAHTQTHTQAGWVGWMWGRRQALGSVQGCMHAWLCMAWVHSR